MAKKEPRHETSREDRLKAALKANMARRKAQAQARKPGDRDESGTEPRDKRQDSPQDEE